VRTRPLLASFLAVSLAFPAQVFAQPPPPPPPPPPSVQPVPYAPSQPVPYASDAPAAVNVPRVGSDVVYLKGGGMIRGNLVEALPNDHATVELATGQSAVIPWERIERIDRGVTGALPPTYEPRPGFTSIPRAPEPTAVVHVQSDGPVVVERRVGRSWVYACSSPCDADLPITGTYRISGTEIRNTPAFQLNARPGDHVILDVTSASKGSFKSGIALTGVGGGAMIVGAIILLYVAVFDAAASAEGIPNPSDDGTWNTAGGVLLAGGAAALVVGILLMTGNSHSGIEQSQGAQRPRSDAEAQRPRNDAWLRTPTWHDDKGAAPVPKAIGVPLFETKF
jgi:hypothetical protein